MTIEQRMESHRQATEYGGGDMASMGNPHARDRVHKPRTVFTPGHRIRMNVVPMFVNVFLPWGFFLFISGVCSFYLMYNKPRLAWGLLAMCATIVVVLAAVAFWFRRKDPEPTWFTYFALMMFLAFIFAVAFGSNNYNSNMRQFYQIQDLKVVSHIDASRERGQNVMDAGVFYFAEGNIIDVERSWHFMHRELYCVVPIVGGDQGAASPPETLSYDFWAVGKDCCSMSASDFRCGDSGMPRSRSAIRVFNDEDIQYYRLAVEQASSLYNIQARNPVFFEWHSDPMGAVNSWSDTGFMWFTEAVGFFFIVCVFCMTLAVCQFSWIGRSSSPYDTNIAQDPYWAMGAQGMSQRNMMGGGGRGMFAP